jgi:hypothetical protein
MNVFTNTVAAVLLTAAAPCLVGPAGAAPAASLAQLQSHAVPSVQTVQYRRGGWRGGRGRGVGIGAGFVAGALIGGAIAGAPYGYGGYAPYGYSGYAPGYVPQGYIDEDDGDDGYAAGGPGGGAGYCAQRYRSYDPRSGTFLGYDGLRHPCP